MATDPWVLGLSASHNGAACLLHGDRIVVAVQEERLTRTKRAITHGAYESLAISYCLDAAGITAKDLSLVVLCAANSSRAPEEDLTLNPRLRLGLHGVPHEVVPHHVGHAVGAFATSGFADAAVLVVDGAGSPAADLLPEERQVLAGEAAEGRETISLYRMEGTRLEPLEKHLVERGEWLSLRGPGWLSQVGMPAFGSLGGMYGAVAFQIFGHPLEGAGKVMGLAPYGRPVIPVEDFLRWTGSGFAYSDAVPRRYPHGERWPARKEEYQDLAASVQRALEEALLVVARRLRAKSGCRRLCYAGGVALNGVANERLVREAGFDEVSFMAAAEDSGTAIGAAYWGLWKLTGENGRRRLLRDAMGRSYPPDAVDAAVRATGALRESRVPDAAEAAAALLEEGKLLGWFEGGSELGPRALGSRSILADPRGREMKDVLNQRVKHREGFRPFAPLILLEDAREWLELDGTSPESPFMLRVVPFRREVRDQVPAVVHADGTGRVQTITRESHPALHRLVSAFKRRTGIPMLLNTSFNVAGEPIAETPADALWCLLDTDLDGCVFADRVVTKRPDYRSLLDLVPSLAASRMSLEAPVPDPSDPGTAPAAGGAKPEETPAGAAEEGAGWLLRSIGRGTHRYARFSVTTPFGRAVQLLDADVLDWLHVVDGRATGHSLLARLREQGCAMDEREWTRQLALLGRCRVLAFRWPGGEG
jgi:carbamoyltransferase